MIVMDVLAAITDACRPVDKHLNLLDKHSCCSGTLLADEGCNRGWVVGALQETTVGVET